MNITTFAVLVTLFVISDLSSSICAKESPPADHDGESNSIIHNWELAENYRMGKNGLKKDPQLASKYLIEAMKKLNLPLKKANSNVPDWDSFLLEGCSQLEGMFVHCNNLDPYAILEIAEAYREGCWNGYIFLNDKKKSDGLIRSAYDILLLRSKFDDAKALYYLGIIEPYLKNEIENPFDGSWRSRKDSLSSLEYLYESAQKEYGPAISSWAWVLIDLFLYDREPLSNIEVLKKNYEYSLNELQIDYISNHPGTPLPDFTGYMKEEAYKWNIKAAGLGDCYAMEHVGFCYEKGIGVTKNMQRAILWYIYADQSGNDMVKERRLLKISKSCFKEYALPENILEQKLELVPVQGTALIPIN